MYCGRCHELYMPKARHSGVDGAFFGTTFPHMLYAVHPPLRGKQNPRKFVPRMFGFKIHGSAPERQLEQYRAKKKALAANRV